MVCDFVGETGRLVLSLQQGMEDWPCDHGAMIKANQQTRPFVFLWLPLDLRLLKKKDFSRNKMWCLSVFSTKQAPFLEGQGLLVPGIPHRGRFASLSFEENKRCRTRS